MNLLLITGESSEIVRGKPAIEDYMNGLVIQTFQHVSYERKTFPNHFVLIKDFNKFVYNKSDHKCKKHFCMYCLQCFSTEDILAKHTDNCMTINGEQAVKMPEKGNNILKYENFHKQQPTPFVIYADFEAMTEKVQGCQPNNDESYTDLYCGFGYKVVCCYDDKYYKHVQISQGEKAVYKFLENMLTEIDWC